MNGEDKLTNKNNTLRASNADLWAHCASQAQMMTGQQKDASMKTGLIRGFPQWSFQKETGKIVLTKCADHDGGKR